MAIYYESGYNTPSGEAQLNPFPAGFRMTASNPFLRTCDGNPSGVPTATSCNGNVAGGNGQKYTYFPTINCPTSLRMEINFPACWDGKNLYLANSGYMSYAANGGYQGVTALHLIQSRCPACSSRLDTTLVKCLWVRVENLCLPREMHQ